MQYLGRLSYLSCPNLCCVGEPTNSDNVLLLDIAEQIFRLDEVIAGIQVAVMFQSQAIAAGFVKDAHPGGGQPQPTAGGSFEGLDKDLPNVMPHPLVKRLDQETAKLLGLHGAGRNLVSGLNQVEAARVRAFDDRDKLDPGGPRLVAQEAVNSSSGWAALMRLTVVSRLYSTPCFCCSSAAARASLCQKSACLPYRR